MIGLYKVDLDFKSYATRQNVDTESGFLYMFSYMSDNFFKPYETRQNVDTESGFLYMFSYNYVL